MHLLVKGLNKADQKAILNLPLDQTQLRVLFGRHTNFAFLFQNSSHDKFYM